MAAFPFMLKRLAAQMLPISRKRAYGYSGWWPMAIGVGIVWLVRG